MGNNYIIKYFLIFNFVCSNLVASAQNGMAGKEFWLGFIKNEEEKMFTPDLMVHIHAENDASGNVSVPSKNWSTNFSVASGNTVSIRIPDTVAFTYNNFLPELWETHSINILADKDVSVNASNFRYVSTDASYILPNHMLKTDYFTVNFPEISTSSYSNTNALIIAIEDNTTIEIIPSVATDYPVFPPGTPQLISLNKGETFRLSSQLNLTGTIIRGKENCNPFAVFAGSECVSIQNKDEWGNPCYSCDQLFHQMPPLDFWGKHYYIPDILRRYALNILAAEDSTSIFVDGNETILNSGEFFTLPFQTNPLVITSDKPILAAKFLHSACQDGSGDPSMSIVTPYVQYASEVHFSTLDYPDFVEHYLTIVMRQEFLGQLKLNGINFGNGFIPFSNAPDFAYKTAQVPTGNYTLTSENGFSASIFGIGWYNSYLFSAGINGTEPEGQRHLEISAPVCTDNPVVIKGSAMGMENPTWIINDRKFTGPLVTETFLSPEKFSIKFISGVSGTFCPFTFDTVIIAYPNAHVKATDDTTVFLGDYAYLSAIGDANYAWAPGNSLNCTDCPNPIANPKETTTYFISVGNEFGCTAIDSVTVFVEEGQNVYLPNIFSPNGDGQNDLLYVRGIGISSFEFSVYNRWGEKVFETTDLNSGWDGSFKGEKLPPSVFVYTIDAILESGQRVLKKGDVTLVR